MARRSTVRRVEEFVLFDVLYEDGTRTSNRKIPDSELGDIDGDLSAKAYIETQDRRIAEISGKPRTPIKFLTRVRPAKACRGAALRPHQERVAIQGKSTSATTTSTLQSSPPSRADEIVVTLLAPVTRRMSARRNRNPRCFNDLPYHYGFLQVKIVCQQIRGHSVHNFAVAKSLTQSLSWAAWHSKRRAHTASHSARTPSGHAAEPPSSNLPG